MFYANLFSISFKRYRFSFIIPNSKVIFYFFCFFFVLILLLKYGDIKVKKTQQEKLLKCFSYCYWNVKGILAHKKLSLWTAYNPQLGYNKLNWNLFGVLYLKLVSTIFCLKSSFCSQDIQIFIILSLPFHTFQIQKGKRK